MGSARNISVTLPRGQSATLTKEAKLDLPLIAPLPLRSRVGEYVVSAGDEVVARIPLVTLDRSEGRRSVVDGDGHHPALVRIKWPGRCPSAI